MTDQKAPERAPLLSDAEIDRLKPADSVDGLLIRKAMIGASRNVRDYYEALITSGLLLLPKTCTYTTNYETFKCCSACEFKSNPIEWGPLEGDEAWKHCPGCGAKIVTA